MAKRLGARLTPASGAANTKGDAVLGDMLLEAKSTTANSMSLKLDWLIKIASEALLTGRTPALTVTFTNDKGDPHRDGAWVLIPERVFKDLTDQGGSQ